MNEEEISAGLQRLGKRLAELLDEDQFAECEALLLAAAPSAPKADDPVKQMLLDALEEMLTPAVRPLSGNTLSMSPVKMVAHIEAAIAAARKGEGE